MRRRRAIVMLIGGAVALALLFGAMPTVIQESLPIEQPVAVSTTLTPAIEVLNELEVKGRAPKTGYDRSEFGSDWAMVQGCDTRDIILYRDLTNTTLEDECTVISGVLQDSYTGETIQFSKSRSSDIQIDHVVALSDAWQKGAQQLTRDQRIKLANDPLELIAVSGKANQIKSDGDAATWLPSNKSFRCEYVARQIAVKQKYSLWVTQAENEAMNRVLQDCPNQLIP